MFRAEGETAIHHSFSTETGPSGLPEFIISPFDTSTHPVISLAAGNDRASMPESLEEDLRQEGITGRKLLESAGHFDGPVPEKREIRRQHREEVEHFVSILKKRMESSGQDTEKIVAARREFIQAETDPLPTFLGLCSAYPEANVFLFVSPETGLWIGASPETLLKSVNGAIQTMSLAGTKECPAQPEEPLPWDSKNLREQELVTDYIVGCLRKHGLEPECGEIHDRRAGRLLHLCTSITAPVPVSGWNMEALESLLEDLAPTPALCGSRKEQAKIEIVRNEGDSREYYGGYCGIIDSEKKFDIWVTLRCARIYDNLAVLYGGGGITAFSDPDTEWVETENKTATLGRLLSFFNNYFLT